MGPIRELWRTGRAWCRDAVDRIHPGVLLGGSVALVVVVFGALSLLIIRAEGGLDPLGLRPPDEADAATDAEVSDGGASGDTELAIGLEADGGPSRVSAAGDATGDGDPGDGGIPDDDETTAGGDGAGGTATRSPSGADADDGSGRMTGQRADGTSPGTSSTTTTAGSPAPGSTQTTTTAPPTTAPPDDSSGSGGVVGGLLQLLGLG